MSSDIQIHWMKNMCLRCASGDQWVDFGFDLGGGEKDLPLERTPSSSSPNVTPEIAKEYRAALVEYLKGQGYSVVDVGR